jgi:hypothetical protein
MPLQRIRRISIHRHATHKKQPPVGGSRLGFGFRPDAGERLAGVAGWDPHTGQRPAAHVSLRTAAGLVGPEANRQGKIGPNHDVLLWHARLVAGRTESMVSAGGALVPDFSFRRGGWNSTAHSLRVEVMHREERAKRSAGANRETRHRGAGWSPSIEEARAQLRFPYSSYGNPAEGRYSPL